MELKEMDKLTEHLDRYFEQDDAMVIHPIVMDPHIDVLLYPPTGKYPFWKLATMGASDFKMNGSNPLGNRNEYLMFVDGQEDLNDKEIRHWYYSQLMEVAMYPVNNDTMITYGHSLEWKADEGEEMTGAYLEMPQIIENPGILRCKLGLFKTAVCLQVVLLNREDIDRLLEIGPEQFSYYLYPDDEGPKHFLSQRKRTEKF